MKAKSKIIIGILSSIVVTLLLNPLYGQTCVSVNAGPDVTICAPQCTTLTAAVVPSNATTSYTQSVIPYAPDPFNVGTAVSLSDDSQTGMIPLPFPFCYYGTVYNNFIIGSNGWLGFSATTSTWVISNPIPDGSGSSPRNCIMGPWQDINPSVGGTIRYQVYGTTPCRRLVVSWNGVPMYSCGTPATQQIVLYETTNIIDNFLGTKPLCAGWNQGRAIQGLHNAPGNAATVVPGRNSPTQWTANNEGRRYTPAGLPTYAVTWWVGNTQVGTGLSINVCPTSTTTYTAQVVHTNCNNQTVTVTDQVIVNVSTLLVNVNPTQVSTCPNQPVQLSANAQNAISYSWSPATFLNNPNIANPISTPTATTTYTVTVSNGTCTGTATVTVTVLQLQNANAGPDVTVCYGGSTQLNASGGVSYSWLPTTGLSNPNINNPICTPTSTTSYTVTVTDANGCSGTDVVVVTANPQIILNTAGFSASCNGSCNGQAAVIPSGGTSPFSFLWSNGGTNASLTGLCAGTYTITVTDANNCTATDTAIVTQPAAIVLQVSAVDANCGLPDGSVSSVVNGGVGPYTYLWTPGNYTTASVSNIGAANYCVLVTDANQCTSTACVTVNNTPGVTLSTTSTTSPSCFNSCNGSVTVTAANGTPPYSYTWSPNIGTTATVNNVCAGTYTCMVTDNIGCTDTTIVTITQPSLLSLAPIPAVSICYGTCTNLTAVPGGGTPGYTYDWQPGSFTTSIVNVCPTTTTTYTVTVTDVNGCSVAGTVTVTVRPQLTATASNAVGVCPGVCANLSVLGGGGNGGPYTYTWMPGNLTGANVSVCPTVTTQYTVTVGDGCTVPSVTDTVTVTVYSNPVINLSVLDNDGCQTPGLCTDFSSSTPGASYSWTFQGGVPSTSSSQNPTNVCFTAPGTYDVTLTVIDVNGCSATSTNSGMVTVYADPVANFDFMPNDPTALNGTVNFINVSLGANSYWWNFDPSDINASATSFNASYTYLDTGNFVVTLAVMSPDGCVDTIQKVVYVRPDFAFYAPNAFTPNGDDRNEIFNPEGMYWDENDFNLYIFDRWGSLIFQTNKITEGWNGKANGGNVISVEDVYVWKVLTTDKTTGTKKQYVGHVTLIR